MPTPTALVPADQVIATAMTVLKHADSIDRAFFKEWVYLALIELGPSTQWYGECEIYPNEIPGSVTGGDYLQLRKPDDYYQAIDVCLYDATGKELKSTYRGLGSRSHQSDNGLLNSNMYMPTLGAPIDLSEDQYYFILGSNALPNTSNNFTGVASAKLKYWRRPVDENGDMLIPESDILPIVYFIRHMWYLREDDKQGIGQSNTKWIAARNECRSLHRTPSMMEGTEIARSWNSMIHKQRYKKF